MPTDPIADLICSGRTISETAETLGQSALVVYRHCERLGLVGVARAVYASRDTGLERMAPVPRGEYVQSAPRRARAAEIVAAVVGGESMRSVADRLELSPRTVRRTMAEYRADVDKSGLFGDISKSPQAT